MHHGKHAFIVKRSADVVLSLSLAPLAIIFCGFMALPIALEARANPFFLQWRLGQNERQFRMLKLRTMRICTPTAASHTVGSDFVLKTGRIARMTKIDELPQLWNVLVGEMSLVGPRPGLPSQIELASERRTRGVFKLRPGITGISQLKGLDMSTPAILAASDAAYLHTWSLFSDIKILMLTAIGKGRGDAAQKTPG